MKLIIMLFCLALDRYLSVGLMLNRFVWFDKYLNFIYDFLNKKNLWTGGKGWFVTATLVAPLPLLGYVINLILCNRLNGVAGFIFGLAVLIYCMGPEDLYAEIKQYTTTENQGGSSALNKTLSKAIFWQANERIFAVLFWFSLLGPLGAILYRVTALLRQSAERADSPYSLIVKHVTLIQDFLDWPSARVFSLGYSLAGSFTKSFAYWTEHLFKGLSSNRELLSECGQVAVEAYTGHGKTLDENSATMALIDRTLIIYLVVVAFFTLGAWLY